MLRAVFLVVPSLIKLISLSKEKHQVPYIRKWNKIQSYIREGAGIAKRLPLPF